MKIRINYDLIAKINDAKTGLSIQRCTKKILLATSVSTAIGSLLQTTGDLIKDILMFLIFHSVYNLSVDYFVLSKIYKLLAEKELYKLVSLFLSVNFNTNYELLLKAYEYCTKYKIEMDENKIPRLMQEKYIIVPVVDVDGEKEVSLVQEHIVGTKEYDLSYGSPTKSKVLKPLFNC